MGTEQPPRDNNHTIPATCQIHPGAKGFCNLRMTKVDGSIVLNPHVTGSCMIELDEHAATAVRDTITEWLA